MFTSGSIPNDFIIFNKFSTFWKSLYVTERCNGSHFGEFRDVGVFVNFIIQGDYPQVRRLGSAMQFHQKFTRMWQLRYISRHIFKLWRVWWSMPLFDLCLYFRNSRSAHFLDFVWIWIYPCNSLILEWKTLKLGF